VLVLETKGPASKTKLVFSRGKIAVAPGRYYNPATNSETLRLETLVFERDASAGSNTAFSVTGGASCKVTYTFGPNPDYPCRRAFDPKRLMRSSPVAKMQASQTLVGYFTASNGHGIAFPDACLKYKPIILQKKGNSGIEFEPASKEPVGTENDIKRVLDCRAIPSAEYISGPVKD
jgi:hypothetical protein